MSTIEPIRLTLPAAEGGYYRFDYLPRLIAEAAQPDNEEADADPQGRYYTTRAFEIMALEKELPGAARLTPDVPGYLHVVDGGALRKPLTHRSDGALRSGLVHLDWLNAWGAARQPPIVFVLAEETGTEQPQSKKTTISLTTSDIAFCFAGLGWSEEGWKKPLGDKPKWLRPCIATSGVQGRLETRWNPVLIGGALVQRDKANARSVRARFQTKPQLKEWLDAWKAYEVENLDNPQ